MIHRLIARGVDGIIAVSVGGIDGGRAREPSRVPPIVYVDQPQRRGNVLLFDGAQGDTSPPATCESTVTSRSES
jgi:hypothetical protein